MRYLGGNAAGEMLGVAVICSAPAAVITGRVVWTNIAPGVVEWTPLAARLCQKWSTKLMVREQMCTAIVNTNQRGSS